jgi:TonB family protein
MGSDSGRRKAVGLPLPCRREFLIGLGEIEAEIMLTSKIVPVIALLVAVLAPAFRDSAAAEDQISSSVSLAADNIVHETDCNGSRMMHGRNTSGLGPTILSIKVGVDGGIMGVTIFQSSGNDILDQVAAKCAALKWHFKPAKKDGQPVEGIAKINVLWRGDR